MFNNINVKNLIFDVCNQTFDTHKPINSIESNNNIIIDELCFNKMTDINYKQNINSNEQTSVRGNRSLPLIPSDTKKEIKMSTLNFNNSSSICSSNTSIPAENAGDPDSNSAQNFSSKLENVTEWLNKSFDHSKSNLEPASKSPNHLLVQRQQRSNSIAHTRVISDEPFIEINLNKSFYQSKSSAQKEIDSKLKTRYSKSQTHMVDSEPELKNLTPTRKCSLSPHNFRFDKNDQFEDLDLHKPKLEQARNKKDETAGTISAEMAENLKNVHPNSTESIQKPIENRTNFSNEDDEVGPLNIKYQQCKNTKSASKITRSNEGRGFRELSVKRKEAVSNRDMVITDPALLYSLVQKQSINSNCQIPTNNLDNGTYLNSDKIDSSSRRASNHSPIFLEQFSPDNGLYGKQNEQTESNCDQMINLARFRSSSPYRKNSNTDSSESCNNQKQTDVRIRVNSNDFEKLKFDEMHGISNAEDSESVASINYSPKPSSNAGECKSLLNPEEINNSSEKKANSNSFIKHSQIDNDMHLFGDLQIQLSHSEKDQQIIVKILQARNLIAKDANGYSDPFVKVYLLPGREQENKRRTKHVSKNLNPEWNCTVIYPNVHREELKYKTLELTIWDWDRFKSNDFLGIVKIDLSDSSVLNDKPTWYKIKNTTLNLDNNVQEWRKSKETKSASSSFKRKSFKIKRN